MTVLEANVEAKPMEERLVRLRANLHCSTQGREAMQLLAPSYMFQSGGNIVDFSDWRQFSQWPQSG